KTEFSSLLAQTEEHIRFLQELGVEQIDADLPEHYIPSASMQDAKAPAGSEIRPEKYVPGEDISRLTRTAAREKPDSAPKTARRNLFESSRLSGRPQNSGRTSNPTHAAPHIPVPIETMPKKPELRESLTPKPPASLPESNETLALIHAEIGKDCERCRLCENRTQVVNSVGNPNAELMFIGEAPGADEDLKGEPFVGRAGQLLTKMIEGIDLKREDVFIGNINRCRPPGNRQPQTDEAVVCRPFLLREIAVVRPKVIVVMGNTACQNLLDTKIGITKLRGSFKDYFGVKVMPTFHPAYLLRDPRKKREVWEDLKTIRDYLNSTK
ncbi:MAG: hypothetical protein KDB79_09135, partial [Acidobacteria bacterium]|nr:hypothetical protein [Acidobacteriota bacterium]